MLRLFVTYGYRAIILHTEGAQEYGVTDRKCYSTIRARRGPSCALVPIVDVSTPDRTVISYPAWSIIIIVLRVTTPTSTFR